ncbi:diacylglycerol kinase family protein [Streptomyces sp. NPDC014006]|uniref:diacylglycerol kinase family protein n=1 Tax=Streptomyces sp. NPDC014006 TaxID=3364870 RepID=UPI0036F6BFB2
MSDQLLVIIDPVARRTDPESVRIAKDVLSAGAATKVCLPEGPEEFARMLLRRGSRRPVVIGDDRTLAWAVTLLHRRRELAGCALSVVPVGGRLSVMRALGVPTGAVAAARAVLDGAERRLDLLVDDSDGVVLGELRIPPLREVPPGAEGTDAVRPWLRTCRSLVHALVPAREVRAAADADGPARLRVEVDGKLLVGTEQPVSGVSVLPGAAGLAEVEVRPVSVGAAATPLRATGRRVTVTGADFRYRADAAVSGPVRRRTWTVAQGAWALTVPAAQ